MTQIIELGESILRAQEYVVLSAVSESPPHLLFESDQAIGFLVAYQDPESLLQEWRTDSDTLIERHQLGLRRSMEKAWNSYLVLLCEKEANRLEQALLDSVEEDLTGTRKIARAGIRSSSDVSRAILPLLPLQSPPNLQPVDMKEEIRIRTSQLPTAIVDGFFSAKDPITIMQLLEEL